MNAKPVDTPMPSLWTLLWILIPNFYQDRGSNFRPREVQKTSCETELSHYNSSKIFLSS